jgi:integrase
MAQLFIPDSSRLAAIGFARFQHVPVIFNNDLVYCRECNQYLRDRATLEWSPPGSQRDFPMRQTLLNIGHKLVNWIEWCHFSKIDFLNATYEHVLAYQQDQERGRWSSTGRPLSPGTANSRADEATLFLTWAGDRGLRATPLDVKMVLSRLPARHVGDGASKVRSVLRRAGRAKESYSKSALTAFAMPTPKDVAQWLRAVLEQRGHTKYLACRFILEAGPRKMEVEAVTAEQWPSGEDIARAAEDRLHFVPMTLMITKGARPRTLNLPLQFAMLVRDYIEGIRSTLAYRYYRREGKKAENKLFLSDAPGYEGTPIRGHTIYKLFKHVKPRPRLWSPHRGRDAYACFFVLQTLETEARAKGSNLRDVTADWVRERGEFWLHILQKQLGHSSPDTTEGYLRWLISAVGLVDMANGWHRYLEDELEGAG